MPVEPGATRRRSGKVIAKKRTSKKAKHQPPENLLGIVTAALDDDKAIDCAVIDLAGKSSIADYMVVVSGTSQRHIAAMAEHLASRLKAEGYPSRAEGLPQCDWVLIDAGDIIVHVFRPEVRSFYNLEKMWSVDLQSEVPAPAATAAP